MNKEDKHWRLSRFMKRLDIFGHKQTFRINNKREHRSICGGLVSMTFIICAFVFVLMNFKDFIMRNNVSLIFTNKILDTNPFVNLTQLEFNFAFTVSFEKNSSDALETTSEFLDFHLNLIEWVGEDDLRRVPISFKTCTEADFYNVKPENFKMNEIGKMFCPNITKDTNFTLAGLYTDVWFQYLELKITVKPEWLNHYKELVAYSESFPLLASFFFLDTGVDYENKDNPMPNSINYYYTSMNLNSFKISELFFSTIEFTSDENLLITNNMKYQDTILDRAQDYSYDIPDRTSPTLAYPLDVVKFLIKASPKQYIVNRSYQKVTAFLAEMSGLLSQILFILLVVLNFINRKFSENKIMSQVLKYKGKKDYDLKYLSEIFSNDKIKEYRLSMNKDNLMERSRPKVKFMEEPRGNNEDIFNDNGEIREVEIYQNDENNRDSKNGSFYNNNQADRNVDKLIIKNVKNENSTNLKFSSKKSLVNTARGSEVSSFYPKIQDYSQISAIKPAGSIYNKEDDIQEVQDIGVNEIQEIQEIEVFSQKDLISDHQERTEHKRQKKAKEQQENEKKKRMSKKTTVHPVDSYIRKRDLEVDYNVERFFKLNTFEIFFIKAKCCCRKYRMRKKILKAGQQKMFFYLDVLTYVKKMQEIDILKYLLLSADQLCLFNFLSKPPVSTNDITSQVYKEFELEQRKITSLTKDEIRQMHDCYVNILGQNNLSNHDKKLLNLIDAEIESIKV
jgi:hypothetical protein